MPDTHEVLPARPPYDGATAALLERIEALGVFRTMTVENIPTWRAPVDEVRAEFLVRCPDVDLEDVDVVREDGTTLPAAAVRLSRGLSGDRPGPVFLSLHGGGLVMGCRFNGLLTVVPWLRRYGGVIISPEYRLAPENSAPAGVEDCYGTLCWAIEHAAGLGIDVPVLMLISTRSDFSRTWNDDMHRADLVLDVDALAARAPQLGRHVTLIRIERGKHDLVLSEEEPRERFLDEVRRWLDAYA